MRKRPIAVLLWLPLFFAGAGAAVAGERAVLSAEAEIEWAFGTRRGTAQKLELVVVPELQLGLPFGVDLTAIGRLRADAYDRLEPGQPSGPAVSDATRRGLAGDQVEFELRELYVEAEFGRALLTLGKQQIVWGQADGLKVLDVVNPQSFREFILDDFDDSRIPLWAANLEVPVADLSLQLLWVPDKSYHEIPEPGAVYEFRARELRPPTPPGVAVQLNRVKRPSRLFRDSDVGARLFAFAKGWDLTLNYLYHYHDAPVLRTAVTFPPQGPTPLIVISPRYHRTHLVGGTFSNAFGDLTLRGELGFQNHRFFSTLDAADSDGVARAREISYVLGLDWFGFEDTLLSLQVFQTLLPSLPKGLVRDRVDTNWSLLARRNFWNETLLVETIWIHNADRGDGVVRPKVTYEVSDAVSAWIGFDVFYGSSRGLFGEFDGNDRAVLGVSVGL